MIFDGFSQQLPDIDPQETAEWVDSLEMVADERGRTRARFLLMKLLHRARELGVGLPNTVSSPYINTIPPENEPWFPGDEHIERRIRAFIRWNAAVMVSRANKRAKGIGGHLATYASSASLYEVGFNHFFRGKDDGQSGDQIFFQGHAAPGIYARAFLEGRLTESQLDHFRQEISAGHGGGLSSYPHPRLMPDFWEFPTVSMGIGPINAVYQARFNRYLLNRELVDTSKSRVWCFVGDGEFDEPESTAGLTLAAREQLDNLIFVVNCNLQRLDGPVRGNGKVIQEMEALFRGAGWNVIKVIWGSGWDPLLARDVDGVLLNKMNTTLDGEFQKYATESGAYIREHFFGPDPRLRSLVEDLSDDDLRNLPRGGHDYRKLYAAYSAAIERNGAPTVILAKTIKGWTLGPGFEAVNATHQIKEMSKQHLATFRERLHLQEEIPEEALDAPEPPYYRPAEGSAEYEYMMERLRALSGSVPKRVIRQRTLPAPDAKAFAGMQKGSGKREFSTTMAMTGLLRDLLRDKGMGANVVPIIPDEARTFGMDALFPEVKIYAPFGQLYEPVDAAFQLSYQESVKGQILEEGITEAGSMASFTAAGTAAVTHGRPMVPFFVFYSMFGFQRVGDL
ncbi:MAG TPA: pyruvate dehydrogenase (acetyl-transferring), homodimeric type, partial [Acidimicrobiales bacterium]|nr:pyruvate dehydrogenase (acetyl-transferring), homodimeric type [Acidimicrobiales bacterium]